jgi:hypothetical protein
MCKWIPRGDDASYRDYSRVVYSVTEPAKDKKTLGGLLAVYRRLLKGDI